MQIDNIFLWDNKHKGKCTFVSCYNNFRKIHQRDLNDIDVLIRHQEEVDIIAKIESVTDNYLSSRVYSQKPFGLRNPIILWCGVGFTFCDSPPTKW